MSQYINEPEQNATAGSYQAGTGKLPPTPPIRPRRPGRRRIGLIAAVIALLLLMLLLFFFPRPAAAVTLTPASKTLSNTGMAGVQARELHSTQQGSQAGVSTGRQKPGTHATGILTFKNYTSSWVTIPKGTVITNGTGQKVVTLETLDVPPDPIIPGTASVSAQAVKTGISGNIAAMSINKQYSAGVFVLNESAYSGGLDDSTVHSIQQSDVDTIAHTLEPSLMQKAQSDFQAQLQSGEQLVNATSPCATKVTSNPGIGASAANFTVTVKLVCSNSAYNLQSALTQAADTLKQQAAQQLGPGYILVGNIITRVEQVTAGKNGNVNALLSARGTWKYQFTTAMKLNMAQHIARATIGDAKAWLLRQAGVADSSISVTGPIIDLSGSKSLPDDIRAITING